MPRSSSISSIPSTAPGHPTSTQGPPPHARSHPPSPPATSSSAKPRLAKATSLADLRLAKHKLFARFRGNNSAAGDDDELWGTTAEEEAERTPTADTPRDNIQQLSAPPSTASTRSPTPRAPRRPAAPYAFPLDAALSAEELRRLERQREAELAAAAALDYTLHSSHARRSSRSSSAAQVDTPATAPHSVAHVMERLNLGPSSHAHKRSLSREVLEPAFAPDLEGRERSDSVASLFQSRTSSECSSRPRTNDSLPSFAESASTVDTTGSFPPSPVQSPTLRSRPTFGNSYKEVRVDSDAIAAQPRAYAFI